MNRRTVLRSTGALATVGLAGCLGDVQLQNPFSLSTPVPIVIHNVSERSFNIELTAYDPETGRGTYEEGFSITPDERVAPSNLGGSEQRLRVLLFEVDGDPEDGILEEVAITEEVRQVNVRVLDFDLEIELDVRESDGNETVENGTAGNETDGNETAVESEDGDEDNESTQEDDERTD